MNILDKKIKDELDSLSPEEKEVFKLIIQGIKNNDTSILDFIKNIEYERQPVDMKTFLEDDYYLGVIGKQLYPKLKEDLIEIFSPDKSYNDIIFSGSIGYGKTWVASIGIIRIVYELSCLRSPQESLHLAPDTIIAIVNVSITQQLAKKVIFENIASKIKVSPYFNEVFPAHITKSEIIFPKNIWIAPGASSDTNFLGLNIFAAVIDETNFFDVSPQQNANFIKYKHFDNSELLYTSIIRRMKSRFLYKGKFPCKVFIISSARNVDSFLEKKMEQSIGDPTVFVRRYAKWEVNPDIYSKNKFYVLLPNDKHPLKLILTEKEKNLYQKDKDEKIIEIPIDFLKDFQNEEHIEDALRDIAGISFYSSNRFLGNVDKIMSAIDDTREHPFSVEVWNTDFPAGFLWDKLVCVNDKGERVPIYYPNSPRIIHIDPSLSGDATGFCMGCIAGKVEVIRVDDQGNKYSDTAPLIHIDLLLRIVPPSGGEIIFADIRNLIYQLSEHGFPIRKITMDRFQSADTIQILREKGYVAEVISVDTSLVPYNTLKSALYENRIRYYRYQPLLEELSNLKLDLNKRKVDHPKRGRKDVADALCGVVYSLSSKTVSITEDIKCGLTVSIGNSSLNLNDEKSWDIEDIDTDAWIDNGTLKFKKFYPPFIF